MRGQRQKEGRGAASSLNSHYVPFLAQQEQSEGGAQEHPSARRPRRGQRPLFPLDTSMQRQCGFRSAESGALLRQRRRPQPSRNLQQQKTAPHGRSVHSTTLQARRLQPHRLRRAGGPLAGRQQCCSPAGAAGLASASSSRPLEAAGPEAARAGAGHGVEGAAAGGRDGPGRRLGSWSLLALGLLRHGVTRLLLRLAPPLLRCCLAKRRLRRLLLSEAFAYVSHLASGREE